MWETIKYPGNLLFFLVPVILLIVLIIGKKKKDYILKKINMNLCSRQEWIKIIMILTGLIIICISLLGPQKYEGTMEIKKESLDIYVLLDTSKSMLVEDVIPNRLEREKQLVNKILEGLNGDRVGFIPFSSSSYVQMPLTDDYDMAQMFLDVLDTEMIGGGGSDLSKAIELAKQSFNRSTASDKVILIISDGEEQGGDSEAVLKKDMDDSLKVYSIGVGTKEGGLIPIYSESGHIKGYKKDNNGNAIMSKLEDMSLRNLAKIGDGRYYESKVELNEADAFIQSISKLKKDNRGSREVNRYKHLYQYYLACGLVLFLIGYLLPVRRHNI